MNTSHHRHDHQLGDGRENGETGGEGEGGGEGSYIVVVTQVGSTFKLPVLDPPDARPLGVWSWSWQRAHPGRGGVRR